MDLRLFFGLIAMLIFGASACSDPAEYNPGKKDSEILLPAAELDFSPAKSSFAETRAAAAIVWKRIAKLAAKISAAGRLNSDRDAFYELLTSEIPIDPPTGSDSAGPRCQAVLAGATLSLNGQVLHGERLDFIIPGRNPKYRLLVFCDALRPRSANEVANVSAAQAVMLQVAKYYASTFAKGPDEAKGPAMTLHFVWPLGSPPETLEDIAGHESAISQNDERLLGILDLGSGRPETISRDFVALRFSGDGASLVERAAAAVATEHRGQGGWSRARFVREPFPFSDHITKAQQQERVPLVRFQVAGMPGEGEAPFASPDSDDLPAPWVPDEADSISLENESQVQAAVRLGQLLAATIERISASIPR